MESLKLPNNLFSKSDLMQLMRELNSLNDFFVGAAARQTGNAMQLPKTSRIMNQLAELNGINLVDAQARKQLAQTLEELLRKAPAIRMSFATDPSPKTLEPVLVWLRTNIHPQLLLELGLQPSLAAGCMVRTPNKIYDFSLRTYLEKQSQFLTAMVTESVNRAGSA